MGNHLIVKIILIDCHGTSKPWTFSLPFATIIFVDHAREITRPAPHQSLDNQYSSKPVMGKCTIPYCRIVNNSETWNAHYFTVSFHFWGKKTSINFQAHRSFILCYDLFNLKTISNKDHRAPLLVLLLCMFITY